MASHPSREGYALPRRDDENNAKWDALDVSPEARLVGIGEGDVRERALCDREHVVGTVKEPADFAWNL